MAWWQSSNGWANGWNSAEPARSDGCRSAASVQTGRWVWVETSQAWDKSATGAGVWRDNRVAPQSKRQYNGIEWSPGSRGGKRYLPENMKELNYLETFRTDTECETQEAKTLYDKSIQNGEVDPATMETQITYLRKFRKQ